MNNILDWKFVASKIHEDLKKRVSQFDTAITLWAVLIWDEDSPSLRYIHQKRMACEKIGLSFSLFHFPKSISEDELIDEIHKLNNDNNISAYIVQLPLPAHINSSKIIEHIDPSKDADWFHPENQWKVMIGDTSWFTPCTPAGIIQILEYYNIQLSWKKVCMIWKSNIVWKPLSLLCVNAGATVTLCHSKTPDINQYTKIADIIISATWVAWILTPEMTSKSAIIIDVWFSLVEWEICWDSETQKFIENGNLITPVPWGVWPMTVAMLLFNTLKAYERR